MIIDNANDWNPNANHVMEMGSVDASIQLQMDAKLSPTVAMANGRVVSQLPAIILTMIIIRTICSVTRPFRRYHWPMITEQYIPEIHSVPMPSASWPMTYRPWMDSCHSLSSKTFITSALNHQMIRSIVWAKFNQKWINCDLIINDH